MDGMDNRVVVARLAVVQGDKADSVPMVIYCVASRITVERSAHFVHTRDRHYHPGAHIARVGLHK